MIARDEVVRIARSWLGTPYHHQASLKGVGCDCLGLVRGVYRDLFGREAEAVPAYSRDWAEVRFEETLLNAANRQLVAKSGLASAEIGDVIVFRLKDRFIAKHAAIYSGENVMIHAQEKVGCVEVPMGRWWGRRVAGVFQFPGVE